MSRIIFILLLSLIYSLRSYLVLGNRMFESKIAIIFIGLGFLSLIILLFRLIRRIIKALSGRK